MWGFLCGLRGGGLDRKGPAFCRGPVWSCVRQGNVAVALKSDTSFAQALGQWSRFPVDAAAYLADSG